MKIGFRLNGEATEVDADPRASLLRLLRDTLGAFGTKEGCGAGECGSCTVLVGGRAVNACLVPAGQAQGREVTTIEGLGTADDPHTLQHAFAENGAVQCGFCTPGMILAAYALLQDDADPNEDDIREALSGNLCRCTGYQPIVNAVKKAARKLRK